MKHLFAGPLLALLTFTAPAAVDAQAPASSTITVSAKVGVVETQSGKVQGLVREGIYNYRGIPYATAERFGVPTKPGKWNDTRLSISYGAICPQVWSALNEPQTFLSDWKFWPQSENCLNLNVWTPNPDGKKRPVMVWFHGGGFFSGSSIELPGYEGTNLSRMGDVVVVTVNHRLNVLGFLDLSAYGDAYKSSGNVGMLDLVASLEWVRDNIAAFGGDPGNVTIFGQSGGGGKVSTLLAAPSAKGLFHKAIIMSGAGSRGTDQVLSRRVAELTFKNAGLQNGDIAGLKKISYEQLTAASAKALADVSQPAPGAPAAPGPALGFPRVNWGPVFDHAFLTEQPFAAGAPAMSANVPLLIGSTLSEFQFINPRLKGRESWTEEQTMTYLRSAYGDRTDKVIAAFKRAYPKLPLTDVPAIDFSARGSTLNLARIKATQSAPVYNYLFAWRSPIVDYAWPAGHTADVAFVFNNAALGAQSSGGGPEVDKLTAQMSQAWINFARTGNPNAEGLPNWPNFTAAKPVTMVFDNMSWIGTGHDAQLLPLLAPPPPPAKK